MNDRFKFNAIVSSYYEIDTPDDYKEFEPTFYLRYVDVFANGEIGIDYDVLFDTVKNQAKDLTDKEIGKIMQHFEDNSNSPECDYVTIRPDKIMQCTGLKDKNGKLIYEGDILLSPDTECPYMVLVDWFDEEAKFVVNAWNGKEFEYLLSDDEAQDLKNFTIAGNIYENKDLLEE